MTTTLTAAPRKQVTLPQGTIRYREVGTGQPIVFVHGFLVNGRLWEKVVPLLAPRFRCIVPDWPLGAHALPMPPDADLTPPSLARLIADFIAALGLEQVTLVGSDTGGALCQLVITAHGQRVARLVLTNCDAFEQFPPRLVRPLQWAGYLPGFAWVYGKLLRVHSLRWASALLALLVKRPIERAVLDEWFSPIGSSREIRRDVHKILRGVSGRYTLAAARAFPTLPQPVLLAWAPEDRVFTVRLARRLEAAFRDARLTLIDDALTFTSLDQPEQLATTIERFIAATPDTDDVSIAQRERGVREASLTA